MCHSRFPENSFKTQTCSSIGLLSLSEFFESFKTQTTNFGRGPARLTGARMSRYKCNRIRLSRTQLQLEAIATGYNCNRIQLQPDTIATGYNCNRIQLQPDTIVNCLINVTSLKNNVVTMKKLPLPKT